MSTGTDTENKVPARKKLNIETFTQISGALARLHEIRNTEVGGVIQTRERKNDALKLQEEAAALIEFLSDALISHGQELLGCWHVVNNEYTPLVNGFMNFFDRLATASHDRAEMFRRQAEANVKPAAAPKNVVKMPTAPKAR